MTDPTTLTAPTSPAPYCAPPALWRSRRPSHRPAGQQAVTV